MSKHWQPPRSRIVRIRPAGDWTRIEGYRPARLPAGAKAGLVLIAAACVGVAAGLYQVLGPRDIVADELAVPQAVQSVAPASVADSADSEWEKRASIAATPGTDGLEAARPLAQRVPRAPSDIFVIDGDTFSMGGERIRIAGIDAPETHPPRCSEEARLGLAATQKLKDLLSRGTVTMSGTIHDRYGRDVRNVQVNGQDLGETLIAAGVVRPYGNGRRPWC